LEEVRRRDRVDHSDFTEEWVLLCAVCDRGKEAMQNIQNIAYWLAANRLAAAAFFFGGAAVAVMIYTYFVDYRMLAHQD
jgi:hypothetical protein